MINLQELLPGATAAPNLHPLLVHLPLGLLPTAFLFLALGVVRANERLLVFGRWTLYLAAGATILAAGSGWWAASDLGHDAPGHDQIHIHRNWMLVASALTLTTTMLAFLLRNSKSATQQWLLVGALTLTLGITTIGADRGAYLVYGLGIGVQDQDHSAKNSNADAGKNAAGEGHAH